MLAARFQRADMPGTLETCRHMRLQPLNRGVATGSTRSTPARWRPAVRPCLPACRLATRKAISSAPARPAQVGGEDLRDQALAVLRAAQDGGWPPAPGWRRGPGVIQEPLRKRGSRGPGGARPGTPGPARNCWCRRCGRNTRRTPGARRAPVSSVPPRCRKPTTQGGDLRRPRAARPRNGAVIAGDQIGPVFVAVDQGGGPRPVRLGFVAEEDLIDGPGRSRRRRGPCSTRCRNRPANQAPGWCMPARARYSGELRTAPPEKGCRGWAVRPPPGALGQQPQASRRPRRQPAGRPR